jgi:hypothetical protein
MFCRYLEKGKITCIGNNFYKIKSVDGISSTHGKAISIAAPASIRKGSASACQLPTQ